MSYTTLIIAALVILAGWLIYGYVTTPLPVDTRVNNAVDQIQQGTPSQAMQELKPQTQGDHMLNRAETAIGITPTQP